MPTRAGDYSYGAVVPACWCHGGMSERLLQVRQAKIARYAIQAYQAVPGYNAASGGYRTHVERYACRDHAPGRSTIIAEAKV